MSLVRERINKIFIAAVYFSGIFYAVVSLRYLVFQIYPNMFKNAELIQAAYYLYPLINKITFLIHACSGIFIFTLGPLVFISFQKNWQSKIYLLRAYFIIGLLPLIWPIFFLAESVGLSLSYFIILTIEILWAYTLARAFLCYKKNNISMCLTYLVYYYSISFGAFLWRVFYVFSSRLYHHHVKFIKYNMIKLDPIHVIYDCSWYMALVLAIILAKIIMASKATAIPDDEENY